MTWNVVKRLANQNRVNCLFDMIGQSHMLSFYGTEKKYVHRAKRTVRNEEDKTSFSLGRGAESLVVNLLSDQLAQPEGTFNASYKRFTESKIRNDRTWAVPRLDLGLQRLLHSS